MEKEFFDVFPNLKVNEELRALLRPVKVTKVAVTPKRELLRVYIKSPNWIHKRYIYALEQAIHDQLFPQNHITVKVLEHFCLSAQYTPENFLEVYRESLLLELKTYSALIYNLFYTAKIAFPSRDEMSLTIASSIISQDREEELVHILLKVFRSRCGFENLKITTHYEERGKSRALKDSELLIQEKARQVSQQALSHREQPQQEQGKGQEPTQEQVQKKKAAAQPAEKSRGRGEGGDSFGKKEKGKASQEFRRSLKRSDNPGRR